MYGLNNYYQFPQQQDERIWVQNQMGAEAYLVAPNGFVRLWDSSQPVFYEKRADASGRCLPLEVYEYSLKKPHTEPMDEKASNYICEEIKSLNERLTTLERRINDVSESNANDTAIQ